MPTRVVHVRKESFDIYIGRNFAEFPASDWSNPYHEGPDGTREEVIEKFEQMLMRSPRLLARIKELKDKTLGCWCKPKACHGDVLARLADQL